MRSFLKRVVGRDPDGLGRVSNKVGRNVSAQLTRLVGRGSFGGEHDLVTVLASLHPFTDEFFALAIGIEVGSVDKVSAKFVKSIQEFEGGFLVQATRHQVFPGVADRHGTEAEGGDTDTGLGCKNTVSVKFGDWLFDVQDTHFGSVAG